MAHNHLTILKRGIQQIRQHGARLLWRRFITRKRILGHPPIECDPHSDLEIHIQVCQRDWLNAFWTLASFYRFVLRPFRLVILHDESLSEEHIAHFQRLFPHVVISRREDTESAFLAASAREATHLYQLWKSGLFFTLPKVIDSIFHAHNPEIIQLDPDVLFFSPPTELLKPLTADCKARWNIPPDKGHCDGMFCWTPQEIERVTGIAIPAPFGTGLGRWDVQNPPWKLWEKMASELPQPDELRFMLDQTLLAVHAASLGWEPLSRERYQIEPGGPPDLAVARHYYGKTRDLMYLEGFSRLKDLNLI